MLQPCCCGSASWHTTWRLGLDFHRPEVVRPEACFDIWLDHVRIAPIASTNYKGFTPGNCQAIGAFMASDSCLFVIWFAQVWGVWGWGLVSMTAMTQSMTPVWSVWDSPYTCSLFISCSAASVLRLRPTRPHRLQVKGSNSGPRAEILNVMKRFEWLIGQGWGSKEIDT